MSLRTEKMSRGSSSRNKTQVNSERQAQIRAYNVLLAKAKVRNLDFILVKEKAIGRFLTRWGRGEGGGERCVGIILSDFNPSKITSHYMENEKYGTGWW